MPPIEKSQVRDVDASSIGVMTGISVGVKGVNDRRGEEASRTALRDWYPLYGMTDGLMTFFQNEA